MPLKPGRWTVNSADVDSRFLDLWRGLKLVVPFLEGSGLPFVFGTAITPTFESTPVWGLSAYGNVHTYDGTADAMRLDSGLIDYTQTAHSVMIVFRTTDTDNGVVFYGMGNSADTGPLAILQNQSPAATAGIKVLIRKTGGEDRATGSTTTVHRDGNPHVLIWTYKGDGGLPSVYLDGVELTDTVSNGSMIATTFNTRTVGAVRRTSTGLFADMGAILVAEWHNRSLSTGDVRMLSFDPFGLVRRYEQLFGLTVTLYATGDGTITDLEDETGATTSLWDSIDDDPDTPTDTDWVNNINELSGGDASGFFDITNMPGDFGNADGASIKVRVAANDVASTHKLYVRLFKSDETTTLSDEVELLDVSTSSGQTNYEATITGVSTTATKAEWDAARIRLRWSVT